jgi:hypothetical protein
VGWPRSRLAPSGGWSGAGLFTYIWGPTRWGGDYLCDPRVDMVNYVM